MNENLIEEIIENLVDKGKDVKVRLVQYDGDVAFTCQLGKHSKQPGNFLACSAKFDVRFVAKDILQLKMEQELIVVEIQVYDAAIENAMNALCRQKEDK